ncbi:anti-sigma factor [Sphingobacterium corticibacter]|uniref:anti-sigma factor n=1 Tax=Sphingobacterium corticibacter TaxID=2171749 RepID=UPI0013FE4D6B|nr:anti-sigma factor [Sphingobacterium corticibacter]
MDIKEYISSGIIESYVLGIATEEEVSILDCVRNKHPEVEAAIREAEILLEDTAFLQAAVPPAELRETIWASIEQQDNHKPTEASVSTVSTEENTEATAVTSAAPNRRVIQFSPLAIAATALLVCSVGYNAYLYQQRTATDAAMAQIETKNKSSELLLADAYKSLDMLQNPAVSMISLAGVETNPQLSAVVFWNKEESQVYLMADKLPNAPEGKQYQLWALLDGQPIDAGVVPLEKGDVMHAMKSISNAQAFAITLEDKGGSPTPNLAELRVIGQI